MRSTVTGSLFALGILLYALAVARVITAVVDGAGVDLVLGLITAGGLAVMGSVLIRAGLDQRRTPDDQ